MNTLHRLDPIAIDDLTAIDLRREAAEAIGQGNAAEAFRLWAAKADGTPEAQTGNVLVLRDSNRIGIEWGADATWADIHSDETADDLAEMYLSDGEAYESRA